MTELSPDYFNSALADVDPEVADAINLEVERQQNTLEMIASENFVPRAVLECQGRVRLCSVSWAASRQTLS